MQERLNYDEFLKLYYAKWGDNGPSISSVHRNFKGYRDNCGCWKCQLIELKEVKKCKRD